MYVIGNGISKFSERFLNYAVSLKEYFVCLYALKNPFVVGGGKSGCDGKVGFNCGRPKLDL